MIALKQFLEAGDYRITEGSDYGWQCYGNNAYMLDVQFGGFDTNSSTIIFDRKTQEVFEVATHDYINDRAYRLTNVDYVDARQSEAKNRSVSANEAWEGVNHIDLETEEDFLEKMTAIMSNRDYDTKISIPVDLEDDVLHNLMLLAHKADLTLNEYVENILREEFAKAEYHKPKSWTVTLEENPDNAEELIMPFPEELMESQGWHLGDTLEWVDLKDGTWEIKKKQ